VDEYYCYLFSSAYGLETVALRYFNVFGPRQSLESLYAIVIPKFIDCILHNEPCPVHGDGRQRRDFTYVDNVVEANILAATTKNEVSGEAFNVASGKDYSILDLIHMLNKILKTKSKPNFIDKRPGDVLRTSADISKARKLLGYRTKVHFQEGLERTAQYFKTKGFK
jgi:UDP-glucose 4-epimerase